MPVKPLGRKCYGSIAHLPNSRLGAGDHHCEAGQARIATQQTRDGYDLVIVQEKLDGSNVGVAKVNGQVLALIRAGYLATDSFHLQHWYFNGWVRRNETRFRDCLQDGERLCGEWLMQAHGTRYELPHEPFVVFDLMRESTRATLDDLTERLQGFDFVQPRLIHRGGAFSVTQALAAIKVSGHGALDEVEGAVWRVERNELVAPRASGERAWKVDFLVKYVKASKQDGTYLPEKSGKSPVWNWKPTS